MIILIFIDVVGIIRIAIMIDTAMVIRGTIDTDADIDITHIIGNTITE
jgi:hypothetical protein